MTGSDIVAEVEPVAFKERDGSEEGRGEYGSKPEDLVAANETG